MIFRRVIMNNDLISLKNDSNLVIHENAEFIGTYDREGQLCDYYEVTSETEKYYYYVLRDEEEKLITN